MFPTSVFEQIAHMLPGVIGVRLWVDEKGGDLYDLEVTLFFEKEIPLKSHTRECKAITDLCRASWAKAADPSMGVLPPGSCLHAVSLLFTTINDE